MAHGPEWRWTSHDRKQDVKWNNVIAIGILLAAYAVSAVRFASLTLQIRNSEADRDDAERVIRVTHWQLEPGFREAMQWAIDEYNALPHVREANVRVEQLPITERVYNQFMNVHLISGTAPDIATKGMTRLIQGNNAAKFYTPLGEHINAPNPYNTRDRLSPDLPEDVKHLLETAPWRETFVDGMLGGYDPTLNDYYAVPISNFGASRFFYNRTLLRQVKQFIAEQLDLNPQPSWLQAVWLTRDGEQESGYIPDTPRLREWLSHYDPPATLGQFILYCKAIEAFAVDRNRPFLIPISGSNYDPSNMALIYKPIFLSHFREQMKLTPGENIRQIQALAAWEAGRWSFRDPPYSAFLEFARLASSFFPRGFLGLDREQAQRRFILGNAAIISSGAWDASGIFLGAANRDREEDRFEVVVARPPMPAPDERWHEFLPMDRSEAASTTGVPLAINQQTPHFQWALDFLQFMSSQPVNQEFSKRANWLPAITGAEPTDFMRPFMPIPEGMPLNTSIMLNQTGGSLQNIFTGALKLFMTGDIGQEEFIHRVERFLKNPHTGMPALWARDLQNLQDGARARDRSISVEEFRYGFRDDQKAFARLTSLFSTSLTTDRGIPTLLLWNQFNEEAPFLGMQGSR